MRVFGQQRGRLWIRLILVVGLLVVAAYVVGVKLVFIWTEVACPPGHIERGVTLQDGIYWCVPPGGRQESIFKLCLWRAGSGGSVSTSRTFKFACSSSRTASSAGWAAASPLRHRERSVVGTRFR